MNRYSTTSAKEDIKNAQIEIDKMRTIQATSSPKSDPLYDTRAARLNSLEAYVVRREEDIFFMEEENKRVFE